MATKAPIVGKRVRIMPHTDVFMQGVKYGTVTSVRIVDNKPLYRVQGEVAGVPLKGKRITLRWTDFTIETVH